MPVNLTGQPVVVPQNQDLYQLSDNDLILGQVIGSADDHQSIWDMVREVKRRPVEGLLGRSWQQMDDFSLHQHLQSHWPEAQAEWQRDQLLASDLTGREKLYTQARLISPDLAQWVHDDLFSFLDHAQAKLSDWYQSASYYGAVTAKPLVAFTKLFESYLVEPALPYVEKFRTFWIVALQEFFSFAFLTPALTSLVAYVAMMPSESSTLAWYQYAMIGFLSLVASPIFVQGFKDSFTNTDDGWKDYFLQDEEGELLIDAARNAIPDFDKWGSKFRIMIDAIIKGGLVRSTKVAAILFPKGVPVLKDIPLDMLPKTYGDWAGFSIELVTDIFLYTVYFAIYAASDIDFSKIMTGDFSALSQIELDSDLALAVTAISVLFYCFTAPELSRKMSKYKVTYIRQIFSVLKNPVVMLAGSGMFADGASLAGITAFSAALWIWATYGFQGDPEIMKHTHSS